jgi:uncharacterized membrane protein YtjA (UPF0391 family)
VVELKGYALARDDRHANGGSAMSHYAVVFFVALITSVIGFGAIAGLSAQIAQKGRVAAVTTVVIVSLAIALLGGRGSIGVP